MSKFFKEIGDDLLNIAGNVTAALPIAGPAAPFVGLLTYELDKMRKFNNELKVPKVRDPFISATPKMRVSLTPKKDIGSLVPTAAPNLGKEIVVYKPQIPKSSVGPLEGGRVYGPVPKTSVGPLEGGRVYRTKTPRVVYSGNGFMNDSIPKKADFYQTMVPYQGLFNRRRRRKRRNKH